MTATYQNYEALRVAFPTIEIECYIQKPVEIKDLVGRINAELESIIVLAALTDCYNRNKL